MINEIGVYTNYYIHSKENINNIINALNNGVTFETIKKGAWGNSLYELNRDTSYHGKWNYQIYEYTAYGKKHYGIDRMNATVDILVRRVGKTINIEYSETNPNLSNINQKGFITGVIGFVIGILGFVFMIIPFLGLPLAITSLIMSFISRKAQRNGNVFGLVNLIVGSLSLVMNIIYIAVLTIVFIATQL